MKNLLKKYSFLVLLFLLANPAILLAVIPLQTVKRQVIKTYSSLKKERLIINNQYGDVVIKTWGKQKIMVVVTLLAHAKTTATANKLLNRVNIDAGRDPNQISIISIIKEQRKSFPAAIILQKQSPAADTAAKGKLLPKEGCNIGYEVFLPVNISLSVTNRFGDITIGDYQGMLDLDNKFGNINAGRLTGLSKLAVQQGDIDLKHISSGALKAKGFSKIKINNVSGKVNGTFSSGNMLDIGLSNKVDSIIIDADNIQQMNISGTAATNAGYNLKTILSKLFNKSELQLKELTNGERKPQSKLGVDSLDKLLKEKMSAQGSTEQGVLLQKKKLEATLISQLKKLREYEGTTGNSDGKVRVKVAFSVLNILN